PRLIASRDDARWRLRAFGRGSGRRASPATLLLRAAPRARLAQARDFSSHSTMIFGFTRSLMSRNCKPQQGGRRVTTVASTVGKFVWHEQVSSDPKQAQDFYAQLFGWDAEVFKPGEVDYTMISSGGQSHGGFGKAQEGAPPPALAQSCSGRECRRDGREGQERGREAPCGPVRDG